VTLNRMSSLSGVGEDNMELDGLLINAGTLTWSGSGDNLDFNSGTLTNLATGTITITADVSTDGSGTIGNAGLLRKAGTTGTTTLNVDFVNTGVIEVDSGTLAVPGGFSMGAGALTVALSGIGTGQFGQLAVSGSVTLNGTLNVILTNNFVPAISNQFQIVSCTSRSGTFASVNVPAGISVTYSNSGVYLVVTRPLPVQILSPQLINGELSFGFDTASNQSYSILQNTNLATTNWVLYTNFSGNGSLMLFDVPVTNTPQQFFRVSEP
jgi:hypothetical protein